MFLTKNRKGEYQQQVVYLKRKGVFQDSSTVSSKSQGATATSCLNPPGPVEGKSNLFVVSTEDTEESDDTEDGSDLKEGLPGFQNILQDMIPLVKVKVLKVTAPAKVDRDSTSKLIEWIMNEEDEEKDIELETVEPEGQIRGQSNQEIEMDATYGFIDNDGPSEISVEVVVGGLAQKLSGSMPMKHSLRVPANIEEK